MGNTSSLILIVVVATLGLLFLLPEQKKSGDRAMAQAQERAEELREHHELAVQDPAALVKSMADTDSSAVVGPSLTLPPDEASIRRREMLSHLDATSPVPVSIAAPVTAASHPYFPLVAGTKWIYHVIGAEHLVPSKIWTLELVEVPTEETPGLIRAGFGEFLSEAKIWLEQGAVRLDVLPYVAPLEFLGDRPTAIKGRFLSFPRALIDGSSWSIIYNRKVRHEYLDPSGRERKEAAFAVQTDRARVRGRETVVTGAGRYDGIRIDWLSQLDLETGERIVLKKLTSQVFRKESLWIVRGIGIVKRRISYTDDRAALVTMELVRFGLPQPDKK